MKFFGPVSLTAVLLGALLMLIGAPAHAQSAGLRLMPVGDSITVGYLSSNRQRLSGAVVR